MSNRLKIILLIAVGLLVIAGIIFYFVWSEKNKQLPGVISESAPAAKVDLPKKEPVTVKLPPATPAEAAASSVKAVATTFAERFGSFSNQSGYVNLQELSPVMTAKMSEWVQSSYIPKLKKEHAPEGFYYQITTAAPVAIVLEQNDNSAKIKLTAQRREKSGEQAEVEFIQELTVDLVRQNNNWLVDGAYWLAKK